MVKKYEDNPSGKRQHGKKKRIFDKHVFEGLCRIQCTIREIEDILETDHQTLDAWCKREYEETVYTLMERFSNVGKASLRRNQFKMAEKNASMGIWLGKIYLGQRDMQEVVVNEAVNEKFDSLMYQLRQACSSENKA